MEPDAQLAPRVLLAVNDALLRRVAGVALRERGFSVSATTEGSAALMLAESFSPDVIMVDLELPEETGIAGDQSGLDQRRLHGNIPFGLIETLGNCPDAMADFESDIPEASDQRFKLFSKRLVRFLVEKNQQVDVGGRVQLTAPIAAYSAQGQ